jgi:hypothetical protein
MEAQIKKWEKLVTHVDSRKGGYSDIRLWPCYMIGSGIALLLMPFTHPALLFFTIAFPTFILAKETARIQDANLDSIREHEESIRLAYSKLQNDSSNAYSPVIDALPKSSTLRPYTKIRKTHKVSPVYQLDKLGV